MNILIWYWGRRGGGGRYALELTKALAKEDSVNLHLSLSNQSEFIKYFERLKRPSFNIDTHHSFLSALLALFRLPWIYRHFKQYLINNQIDLVLCPMSHLWNIFLIPIFKKLQIPYLLVVHDATPHPGDNYAVRKLMLNKEIRGASHLVTLTSYVANRLMDRGICSTPHVISHGYFDYTKSEQIPRSFPSDRPFRFLFFGRLLPYKGLELLLTSFKQLITDGENIHLTIAGTGSVSDAFTSLVRDQEHFRLENRWIREAEIADFFEEADAVVLPYTEASQSGVIPIAICFALPAIVTNIGGLPEQVKAQETGIITKDLTAEALAHSLKDLISSPTKYDAYSKETLNYAKQELDWRIIGRQFLEVMNDANSHSAADQIQDPLVD